MENVWKAGTTMSDVDELGKLDAAHQGGTGRDTEFAAEQAKLLDEILASADLGSPATPAVRSIDQTGDAELSHDEGRAALASAPSQPQEHVPQEEVLPVSPPSYEASTSAAAAFTITPLNEDDEAVEPDAGHQPETTGRDAGPAGEEATRLDEIPAAADLGSPGTPEAGTADDTSDAEAPHGQGQAEMGSTPELPRDQAVTVWPSAYSAPAYGAPAYSAPAYGGPAYGTPADSGPTYGAPTSAVAAFTDATTPGKNDEAGELDTARQAATGSDAESAAEDATQIEETPSLADLTSPGTAEDRSFDETSDAEAPHDEGRAEIKPAPEEPQQQVATTWPSAYGALTSAIAALTDTTTPSKDDEAGEPEAEAPLQAETGGDAESSADEETELEKTPAAAELASPETPEARPVDETSDAEGPDDEGQFETGPAPEEPQEEPVTAWPGAYSAPTYSAPTYSTPTYSAPTYSTPTYSAPTYSTPTATVASFTDGAMPSKDGEAGEPEAPLKAETGSETESAAEEATQVEETPVGADLASPGTPEDRSVDETSSAEEPDDEGHSEPAPPPGPAQEEAVTMSPAAYSEPAGAPAAFTNTTMPVGETRESRRRSRVSPAILAVLAAVFLLAALGTGFLAVKQASTARQWRQRDRNEVALNRGLSARDSVLAKDLASTQAAITSLNSRTSKLNGQVKSLQAQLSAVASANRKALNHNGLLGQLTNQASTVSNELSTCVGDMSSLQTEINNDLSKPSYKDPHLQSNTHSADQVCTTARQESQQLQSTLSGA